MSELGPGSRLGRYEVTAPLGSGGMGVVYRAHDPKLDREVAIKLLPEDLMADEKRQARLEREARATAALNHPNLLAIYDIGTDEGVPYLVSELLEGETLRTRITRGRLEWLEALAIGRDIASGLAAAHRKGIVHRDLKPENIFLLEDGRAKILDFGLATILPSGVPDVEGLTSEKTLDRLTTEGVVLGTVGYMAPEQVSGKPSDTRADLFALGVILYEMLSGRSPFRRNTSIETQHAILKEQPEDISSLDVELPEDLSRLVRHLMEKTPAKRFQSARDILYDLDGVVKRSSTDSNAAVPDNRKVKWPVVAGVVAVAVVLGVLGVVWRGGQVEPGADSSTKPPIDRTISVAVLPFEERGEATELEHLALGLPDEIVTELSYAKDLAVRSFTQSSRFTAPVPELGEVGEALGANHLIVGQYGLEGDTIRVSVEAIDLDANEVVWRDSWGASDQDLLALREAMREKVSEGLLVALGGNRQSVEKAGTGPGNARAYDLYLRGATGGYEPAENRQAIETLEQSLELDSGYSPAWLALANRYHYDALLAEGADPVGAQVAYDYTVKALELDPNLLDARVTMVSRDTERGNAVEGFRIAADLVRSRPESGRARVSMAYVLRYGGAIEEAIEECETARRLDPEGAYRSQCHWTYSHAGDFQSALEHIDLMSITAWTLKKSLRADMLSRMGDREAALKELVDANEDLAALDIQRACLMEQRPEELATWVAQREDAYTHWGDPEGLYWFGALMADCGFPETALRFLELSIDRNYCAASALDIDPLWNSIREDARFVTQRQRAQECHEAFMANRAG